MNYYKLGATEERQFQKLANKFQRTFNISLDDMDKAYDMADKQLDREFLRNCRRGFRRLFMAQQVMKEVKEEMGIIDPPKIKQTYFITVRPDTNAIRFPEFFELVSKFVQRKCFLTYKLSFEQKGVTPDDYGKGFHFHMVAHMTQRSKGQVLRDVVSTFKCCTSANCIQVDCLRTPQDVEQCENYFIEYTSDDNHKNETKEPDAIWRDSIGIKPYYTHEDAVPLSLPSIKSDDGQANIDPHGNVYFVTEAP